MTPTEEQVRIIEAARTGENLAIEAFAGTGKTSTLELLAADRPDLRMVYVAFNREVVREATKRFPKNVTAKTAHGLAWQAKAKGPQSARLEMPRQSPSEIAGILGTEHVTISVEEGEKRFTRTWLGSAAVKTVRRFSMSADGIISAKHIEWPDGLSVGTEADDDPWEKIRRQLAPLIVGYARKAWADIADPNGRLRWEHNFYLKLWQLDRPRIFADVILYDEAQDANPAMLSIVRAQTEDFGTQVVYVGDRWQQIYTWNGAINAMDETGAGRVEYLTGSFRFGPAIAGAANRLLVEILGAPFPVRGLSPVPDLVGPVVDPDAILCRTNWGVIASILDAISKGLNPYIVGGVGDLLSFCRAARDLRKNGATDHPELSIFGSWAEVVEYASNDQLGEDLALLVKIVDEFGPDFLIARLSKVSGIKQADADLTISTAHKAKGLEWPEVRLFDDFREPSYSIEFVQMVEQDDGTFEPLYEPKLDNDEEMRLLYVAMTRTKRLLDVSRVDWLNDPDFVPGYGR